MRRAGLMVALVVLSACGTPKSTSGDSPRPTAVGQLASAGIAASARATARATPGPINGLIVLAVWGPQNRVTLRLVEAGGRVAATDQFTAPPNPIYGPCGSIVQSPVRVAGSAVYFADNTGFVHKLSLGGSVTPVTTFPLTNPQQALSYAVSPDGTQLIATVVGTPPLHSPPPSKLGDPIFDAGTFTLDLETANAGGQAGVVLHKSITSLPPTPTVITGWDSVGPTATLNSDICAQNAMASLRYTSGDLVHLGLDGTQLERIGGSDCTAWDELLNGTVLCGSSDAQSFTVRTRTGDVLWSGGGDDLYEVLLSPDASAVASLSGTIRFKYPVGAASYARSAEPQARIVGWAGPDWVVVVRGDGHIGIAQATNPIAFRDLGLSVDRACQGCDYFEVEGLGTIGS